jgi:hypothetical protein
VCWKFVKVHRMNSPSTRSIVSPLAPESAKLPPPAPGSVIVHVIVPKFHPDGTVSVTV